MKKNKLINYFVSTFIFCSVLIGFFVTPLKVKAQPPGRECSTNLMLTLDVSGSMGGVCNTYQQLSQDFIDTFMADPAWQSWAGVVHFADYIFIPPFTNIWARTILSQQLTDNLATVRAAIMHGCDGWATSTEAGIRMAAAELNEEGAKAQHAGVPKVMVLFTDGQPNRCGAAACDCNVAGTCDTGDFCDDVACVGSAVTAAETAAANARASGIRMFVIGFGGAINRPSNRNIASDDCPTSAFPPDCYWEAPTTATLPDIFNEIFLLIADQDGDGFVSDECGGDDEDDSPDPGFGRCVNPNAPEETYCIQPAGTCPNETSPNVCGVQYYCETWQCSLNCKDDLDNDQDDSIDINDTSCPAPSGLVPCGRARDNPRTKEDERNSCTLCHIFLLMKWIIDFLVKVVALPLVVLMALIGGFLFITATGSEARIRMGKNIIKIALISVVIVLTGWIIINTALFFLTGEQQAGIATILGQPWSQVQCSVATQECPAPAVDPPRCD